MEVREEGIEVQEETALLRVPLSCHTNFTSLMMSFGLNILMMENISKKVGFSYQRNFGLRLF